MSSNEQEKITYEQMCEVIVEDWNKEDTEQFTWDQIWNHHLVQAFPALYVPIMYDAAKTGNLVGLLLTDNTCAKIFYQILERVDK